MHIIKTLLLAGSLTLAGCALDPGGRSIFSGGSSLTATVGNPVTPTMLYDVENGLTVAVSGMLAYKRLCIAKTIDRSCGDIVLTLQGYTRQAKPILISLRQFVRQNDQVNAIIAYNTVRQLLDSFKATAATSGV